MEALGQAPGQVDGGRDDERRTAAAAMMPATSGPTSEAGGRRTTASPAASASRAKWGDSLGGAAVTFPGVVAGLGSGRRVTAPGGEAARSSAVRRPAHRHPAHAVRSTTSGAGPSPVTLATGAKRIPSGGIDVGGDDPPADPPAGQRHPHQGAHADLHAGRGPVVELPALVGEGGDVDRHPHDPPGCVGQSPRADFSSASREVTSHVNPSSLRPKCP